MALTKHKPDDEKDDAPETAPVTKEESNSRLVKATNIGKFEHRQPSTGIWVGAGQTAELKEDGWLRNQVKARLFKLGE